MFNNSNDKHGLPRFKPGKESTLFNRSGHSEMILPQKIIERPSDAVDPINNRAIIIAGLDRSNVGRFSIRDGAMLRLRSQQGT